MSEKPTTDTTAQAPALPDLDRTARFEAGPARVRADHILRIQGYTDLERVRPRIRRIADSAAAMAEEVTRGEVAYRRVPVRSIAADGRLDVGSSTRFRCEAFPRFLAGCGEVVVFALTAGQAFDERIQALVEEDRPVDALLLDCAGWLAVEHITRQFNHWLKPAASREGLQPTRRMGPGYSYRSGEQTAHWRLEEQAGVFELIGHERAPVKLLESSAMLPKMSRSGLYGLRPVAA